MSSKACTFYFISQHTLHLYKNLPKYFSFNNPVTADYIPVWYFFHLHVAIYYCSLHLSLSISQTGLQILSTSNVSRVT
jgi:hypothetical protein